MLDPAGRHALDVFRLWEFFFVLGITVWVAVLVALALAVTRPGPASRTAAGERRRTRAVATATTATALILVAVLIRTLHAGPRSPEQYADAEQVDVVGYQWWWEIRHPGAPGTGPATLANELHLPVGEPVRVRLWSEDVIHSFWIPNIHGKVDMMVGRANTLVLQATEAGVFRGQCAEYCGLQHSHMVFIVVAEPRSEYDAWLARQAAPAAPPGDELAEEGLQIFLAELCTSCHTIRGTRADGAMGPDLTHLGSRRTLAAGMFPNDIGHLTAWIAAPRQLKPGVRMPRVVLDSRELTALAHYLAGLH